VLESPSALSFSAQIITGSCASAGDVAFSLGDVTPQAIIGKSTALPVAIGGATIDTPLSQLLDTGHAIGIGTDQVADMVLACGDISGSAGKAGDVVLGLQAQNAENIGLAVLREEGARTTVALYLLNPDLVGETSEAALAAPEEALTVEIDETSTFQPYSLEVSPGATVTWVNHSDVAHTVTGDDLAFDDSELIEPGDSFRQTFDEPGTYRYRCGPHPEMTGIIVVS
jgi:plastocyanin